MIFLTVGTVLPFDRLVRAVDQAIAVHLITMPVFAQIGQTDFQPMHMDWAATLDKASFDRHIAEATYVISHAGIGSIMIALELRKRLLVMPRRKCYGEHVNDHQVVNAQRFAELGYVLVAHDDAGLPARLREIESFVPASCSGQADRVARRISQFLEQMQIQSQHSRWFMSLGRKRNTAVVQASRVDEQVL
jgi:UDP-N-acetylglucosamine transferase subunit ALG13